MTPETNLVFNIGVGAAVITICTIFLGLLGIIWKGKKEIAETIKEELAPFRKTGNNIVNAITEVQTILRGKFDGLSIVNLVEKGSSPLNPTEYGASLIKDSGLEKVLNENKEFLCTKLKASLPKDYTEYDVQEKARQLLLELKDDPIMNPVKEWVYNNPTDIKVILKVGGLWLRSDFLSQPRKITETEKSA